jgi:diguanylate cyclase (GGDEF)-like protein
MSPERIRVACLVAFCGLGLVASAAHAVNPPPSSGTGAPNGTGPAPGHAVNRPPVRPTLRPRPAPVRPPRPPIKPLQDFGPRVQQRPRSAAPGAVDPGRLSATSQAPQVGPAPAQGIQQTGAEPTSAPDRAGSKGSASGAAAVDADVETQGSEARKPDDPAADAESQAKTTTEEPTVQSDRPPANVIERIVGVVPLPLKIALGALVVLLIVAVAGALRIKRRLARAERRAATDALTGLPNRRHAEELIERLLVAARRNDCPLAVVLFDLDHFKQINDRFGHAFGDEALRATADTTRGLLRGSDHVARFGGEEFLLLLPDTPGPDAAAVAEKLRSRIAALELVALDGGMTASFGVAVYPDHGIGADELIKAADTALYRAKETGRNRVEISTARQLTLVANGKRAAA